MLPALLLITGLPCSGKTTLGRQLAFQFRLPFISKDGIKETLFDSLGWSDRPWSRRLGGASFDLMYHIAAELLAAQVSFILESNFPAQRAAQRLHALQEKYPFRPAQVMCMAAPAVINQRWQARARRDPAAARHPGHLDSELWQDFLACPEAGRDIPTSGFISPDGLALLERIPIAGPYWEFDSSQDGTINSSSVLDRVSLAGQIAAFLNGVQP